MPRKRLTELGIELQSTERVEPRSNRALVRAYLDWMRNVKHCSKATHTTYESRLYAWVEHRSPKSLLTAQRGDMETWLTREREKRGAGTHGAAATQRLEGSILRSFYKWVHQEGLTRSDLAVGLQSPSVKNVNPRPISDSLWLELWDRPAMVYERCILGLGFFCGLRRSELAVLRPGQVTPTRIQDFPRKGGGEDTLNWKSIMSVYEQKLPHLVVNEDWFPEAIDAYTTYRRAAPRLFPWNDNPQLFNKELSRMCSRLGIAHVTPHQLRHSAATNLLRAGVPIMLVRSILNHSSVDITMRYVKAGGTELDMWLDGRWGQ